MKKLLLTVLTLFLTFQVFSQSTDTVEIFRRKKFDRSSLKTVDRIKKKSKKISFKIRENLSVQGEEFALPEPEVLVVDQKGRKKFKNYKAPRFFTIEKGKDAGVLVLTDEGVAGSFDTLNITNSGVTPAKIERSSSIHEGGVEEMPGDTPFMGSSGPYFLSAQAPNLSNTQANIPISPQVAKKVYVIDYTLYTALGNSVQACVNWAQTVHAGGLPMWNRIGINTVLDRVIVLTTPSTFSTTSFISAQSDLVNFATEYLNESGDLIHLFTRRDYGGLAYLGGLGNINQRYCVTGANVGLTIVNDYTWTISCAAHEEGHVFGSRHTQWCGWPLPQGGVGRLDSCWDGESVFGICAPTARSVPSRGGTIMSYCHVLNGIKFSNGFHPQCAEVMRRTLANSRVAGGPSAACSWTYGPWGPCVNGVQTRTATPANPNCLGYPDVTARECTTGTAPGPVVPVARFSIFPSTTGRILAPGESLNFIDLSTGPPTSWFWDFGDGRTSTLQSPIMTFNVPGTYTVKLTASNSLGTNTATLTGIIIVAAPVSPVAVWGGTPTTGSAPLTVNFNSIESLGPPYSIDGHTWSFGDGTTSTTSNPVKRYDNPGTYTVSLTVRNGLGTNTLTRSNYITVTPPAPEAKWTYCGGGGGRIGAVPHYVGFCDASTGNPTSWLWNFGDGTTSTEKNPIKTYTTAGTFTVSLTVSGPNGTYTKTAPNEITATIIPVANFVGSPLTGAAPLTVNFTDQSTGNPITGRTWNFGNGQTSTATNPSVTYTTPGTYSVSLTTRGASTPLGVLFDTRTRGNYITVTGGGSQLPVASFTATPLSGTAPLTVAFADASTGSPTSWVWDFGDGSTSEVRNPVYIFRTPGTYTVRLTAGNALGTNTQTRTGYITVSAPPAPVAGFQATPLTGTVPLAVSFTDTSSGNPTNWSWDFGNGTGATSKNVSTVYTTAGTYSVSLIASNTGGADTVVKTGYITATAVVTPPPTANFTGTPLTGTAPLTVNFTDASTGSINSRSWNFGNGQTSTATNPSVTYTTAGTYTVTLTAVGPGGSNTRTRTGYVVVTVAPAPAAPTAQFIGSPLSGQAPLTVNFTDQSTGSINSRSWNFGNGQTSTATNPSVTYTTAGTYTVALTATGAGGSNTRTRSAYITVTAPPVTPTVEVYRKADNRWYIKFNTSSTSAISTDVCRFSRIPCNASAVPQCGRRSSPSTIVVGGNEFLMNPQPSPPSTGTWCYRVNVTQGGVTYFSNYFNFTR